MSTIVIYSSKYGVTKEYAQKIKNELEADIYCDNSFNTKDFEKYDTIIFGGRLTAGKICGLNIIKKNYSYIKDKKIFVFFTGLFAENAKNIYDRM